MNPGAEQLQQSIIDTNFDLKFKLHRLQDRMARSPSLDFNDSRSDSTISEELSKLREQLDVSDANLERLNKLQGGQLKRHQVRSLDELVAERQALQSDHLNDRQLMTTTSSELSLPEKETILESEKENDGGWVMASPQKSEAPIPLKPLRTLGHRRAERIQLERIEQHEYEKPQYDIEHDEPNNALEDFADSFIEPELHVQIPSRAQSMEDLQISMEAAGFGIDDAGRPSHDQNGHESPSPNEPKRTRDAFETTLPSNLEGFLPLEPEPVRAMDDEPHDLQPDFEIEQPSTPTHQNDHYLSSPTESAVYSDYEERENFPVEANNESTKFFDPFSHDPDATESLIMENKLLREELEEIRVAAPNPDIMQLYDDVEHLTIAEIKAQLLMLANSYTNLEEVDRLQQHNERLQSQFLKQELILFSNDRLRTQRNDLAFLCQYQRRLIATNRYAAQRRLKLLDTLGIVEVHDETSAYQIISSGAPTDRRPRTLRGLAYCIIAAIRFRNRLQDANARLEEVRNKVAAENDFETF